MNLSLIGPDMDQVYNTLNLSTTSWNSIEVGSGTPPFNITTVGESGIPFSGGLNIVTSGKYIVDLPLNLNITFVILLQHKNLSQNLCLTTINIDFN